MLPREKALPKGWRSSSVGRSCSIKNNLRFPINAAERTAMRGSFPYFGPTGQLDSIDHYRIDEAFALIGEDGDHFLKFKERPMTLYFEGKANVNNHAHIIVDSSECLAKWFYYCFMHRDLTPVLSRQGVGRYKLTKSGLEELEIILPPVEEQRSIIQLLDIWGSAITTTEKLLANSRMQRKALGQLLISGRRRLGGAVKWRKREIADLIIESRIPGSSGKIAQKLTIKLYGKGVIAKEERRQGSESTNYYKRRAGQFIYSKLDFLNGAFGLVPDHLDGYESTLDLPAFDFQDGVDPRWLLYYVSREEFYQGQLGLANGGRKARRVNPADLLRVSIDYPPLTEQREIANAIDDATKDVRMWESMLAALKKEKRVLMADLLTGKRRLRLPDAVQETCTT